MRRLLLSIAVAVLLLGATASWTSAWVEWCSNEPPVTVRVNGKPVTVNVYISVPVDEARLLHTAQVSAEVDGSTITVTVHGPQASFRAYGAIHRLGLSAGVPDVTYSPGETVRLTFYNVDP